MNEDAKSLSLSVEEKLDATCDRFEAELKAGRTPQIEDFLKQTAGNTHSTLLSLLLQIEIELLSGNGERPEPQSYHERFPDHADVVTVAFARWSTKCNVTDTASQQHSPVDTATDRSARPAGQEQPQTLGRFQIQKVLGEGAMGVVYLAYDPKLRRKVALKVPKFTEESGPEILERFQREARSAAMLNHRNICQVFDVDEQDGKHYIAMAFIEGKPLSDFISPEKPLPQKTVVAIVRKIARALSHAHERGVVHRDLKPANIMIDVEREPVVTDFGLACRTDAQQSRLTRTGAMLGTPAYMSLEQVQAETDRIGPASDQYSLGVILFEMLTGQLPFDGPVTAVIGQIITQPPPKASELNPQVDPQLEAICLKAMAKQIEDRYASMAEFIDVLTGYLRDGQQNVGHLPNSLTPADQTAAATTGEEGLSAVFAADSDADNAPATSVRPIAPHRQSVSPMARRQLLSPAWKWVSAAGAAALLILLSVVLFVQTDKGTVKIEILDPSLTVTVADNAITVDNDGKRLNLNVGKHKLFVEYEGLEIPFEDSFEIRKDQKLALRVTRADGKIIVLRDGQKVPNITADNTIVVPKPGAGPPTRTAEVAGKARPLSPPKKIDDVDRKAAPIATRRFVKEGKDMVDGGVVIFPDGTKRAYDRLQAQKSKIYLFDDTESSI